MPLTPRTTPAMRRDLIQGVLAERMANGWDQPHDLCLVAVHEAPDANYLLEGLSIGHTRDGDELLDLVVNQVQLVVKRRTELGDDYLPLPEGFVGVLVAAEAWMAVRSGPPKESDPAPSEDPDRMEAHTAYFVDGATGAFCTGVYARDAAGPEVVDVADMPREQARRTLEHSRLLQPLVLLTGALSLPPHLLAELRDQLDG